MRAPGHKGSNADITRDNVGRDPAAWWMHRLSSTHKFPIPIANRVVTHGLGTPSCEPNTTLPTWSSIGMSMLTVLTTIIAWTRAVPRAMATSLCQNRRALTCTGTDEAHFDLQPWG